MSRLANEIRGEISSITQHLTADGLAVSSRVAEIRNNGSIYEVGWSKEGPNIAPALKNVPYRDIYNYLRDNEQYNLIFRDGGLLQLLYKFNGEKLIEQRVCYFPVPSSVAEADSELTSDDADPDLDNEEFLQEEAA